MTDLDRRFNALARKGQTMDTPAALQVTLSPLHQAVIDFMDPLLNRVTEDTQGSPPAIRLAAAALTAGRPMIRQHLAAIPEPQLRALVEQLRARVDEALAAGTDATG